MATQVGFNLDPMSEVDISYLDGLVFQFYSTTNNQERDAIQKALEQFQNHEQSWNQVDRILEKSQNEQTKYYALQILETVVKSRWGALPEEQRLSIRMYVSNVIIAYAKDKEKFQKSKTFLNKVNLVLVQILKHDWPSKWPQFMPELVGASKTDQNLCENSMNILRLLSEEVFDFSKEELTQSKTREMKTQMTREFQLVHELCIYVLEQTQYNTQGNRQLLRSTLATLQAFLTWIPLPYIFASNLIEHLLRLFALQDFRTLALKCLTEIGSLPGEDQYRQQLVDMYKFFMQVLQQHIPYDHIMHIPANYDNSSDEDQRFIQNLAQFFTGFFKQHVAELEKTPESVSILEKGLYYLVQISYVSDNEVFKICLDYWGLLVPYVHKMNCDSEKRPYFAAENANQQNLRSMYAGVLSQLRDLMIARMARPEEVIVLEDENGNIVRETMKDVDVLAQYKNMRDVLMFLCTLNQQDTEMKMLTKLSIISPKFYKIAQQESKTEESNQAWNLINTLCWAIGSISGAMQEEQESRFLVAVIKELLNLCERVRGKDNKAVIASCIMYVVGQYPRFLRAHWRFLKTVVYKLFEFMHEKHPGVQDMACDTFLKICQKCKRRFIQLQMTENGPFIQELLATLQDTVRDLEIHQIFQFYEAVGILVHAENDEKQRSAYIDKLMEPPNNTWGQCLQMATSNPAALEEPPVIHNFNNVLRTNIATCKTVGPSFKQQVGRIFHQMLQVYKQYSVLVGKYIQERGTMAARMANVKQMRAVKRYTLKLLIEFTNVCTDIALLRDEFFPQLIHPILEDYTGSVPDAREAEVLSLFAALIMKIGTEVQSYIPQVLSATFEPTLDMITQNMEDYPDHRLNFFDMLQAIVLRCFNALAGMSQEQIKMLIDSVFWACRHTERNIAESGLQLLLTMLTRFEGTEAEVSFYKVYYIPILREVFTLLTDTLHKPGFRTQAKILHHLFGVANQSQQPLWDTAVEQLPHSDNRGYVQSVLKQMLEYTFPNLSAKQVEACILGMLDFTDFMVFKNHLRDFLVQTKQFVLSDNADLYAEHVNMTRMEQPTLGVDDSDEEEAQQNGK